MFVKGQKKIPGSGRKGNGQSPNKKTIYGQQNIIELLTDYKESGLMASDFAKLEPKDRLMLVEKFTSYIVPKRQAIDGNLDLEVTHKTIEDTLAMLAEENEND